MKKYLLALSSLALVACGGGEAPKTETPTQENNQPKEEVQKVEEKDTSHDTLTVSVAKLRELVLDESISMTKYIDNYFITTANGTQEYGESTMIRNGVKTPHRTGVFTDLEVDSLKVKLIGKHLNSSDRGNTVKVGGKLGYTGNGEVHLRIDTVFSREAIAK